MKNTFGFWIFLSVINIMCCGISHASNAISSQQPTIYDDSKYSESVVKSYLTKCTSSLRKAIELNFVKMTDVSQCNDLLGEIVKYNEIKHVKFKVEILRYQTLYSGIFNNKYLFMKSNALVQSMINAKNKMTVNIDLLSKLLLKSSENTAKYMTYVDAISKIIDSVILNAKLLINAKADNDKFSIYLERVGRDTAIVGEIFVSMLNGDDKLRLKKIKNIQARDELLKAQKVYVSLRESVGSMIEIIPDLYELRLEFESLNEVAEYIIN